MIRSYTFILCITALLLVFPPGCSAPPETVKVAAIQTWSVMGEPEANRIRLGRLVVEAANAGAKMIVLPEAAVTGYMNWDLTRTWRIQGRIPASGLTGVPLQGAAETVPGASTEFFGRLSREYEVYVTVPFVEFDPEQGAYYNTVVLMDPAGEILLHYRKLNPWAVVEQSWASNGDRGIVCVDTPYGRISLLICYDINFEPPHIMDRNVDHLLYPIAWVDEKNSDWFSQSLPEIARDHHFSIVGANWSVPAHVSPTWQGYGMSRIIDREGKVLAQARNNKGTEIIYAHLPCRPPRD